MCNQFIFHRVIKKINQTVSSYLNNYWNIFFYKLFRFFTIMSFEFISKFNLLSTRQLYFKISHSIFKNGFKLVVSTFIGL